MVWSCLHAQNKLDKERASPYIESMAPTALGRRVRRLRRELTLTQPELAARAHLHRTHLAKIELGISDPTASTIVKLARALRVMPGELFEDEPGPRGRRLRRKLRT
jgi:transcriptional regulator with XRE-family HTH domain